LMVEPHDGLMSLHGGLLSKDHAKRLPNGYCRQSEEAARAVREEGRKTCGTGSLSGAPSRGWLGLAGNDSDSAGRCTLRARTAADSTTMTCAQAVSIMIAMTVTLSWPPA
jgi:hypothetical protein